MLSRGASLALLASVVSAFSPTPPLSSAIRARVSRGQCSRALDASSRPLWPAIPGAATRLRSSGIGGPGEVSAAEASEPVEIMSPKHEQEIAFRVWPMREAGVQDGDIVIKEGEGWGEGRHPSTYMCLQFVWDEVSTRVKSGATPQVFDYGCGSGVLAIAARRFGAGRVVGVDKDEAILEHAVQNAVLNFGEECEGDENVGHGSENEDGLQFLNGREVMPTASGLLIGDRWEAETFDVVVANMLPAVLIKLAPAIALALTPNSAALALCGMRRDQVAEVRAAYERLGVVFEGERGREGAAPGAKWAEYVQLIGRRPAPSAEQKRALLEYLSDAAVG